MSVIIRGYDKITGYDNISLGITFASTAFSIYTALPYLSYSSPVGFLVAAGAGVAIAALSNTYLIYNNDVKSKSERNNIYTACSLIVGFTYLKENPVIHRVISGVANTFAYFGQYPAPVNLTYSPAIGFLLALGYFQIKHYRSS